MAKLILPNEPLPDRNLIITKYGEPGVAKTSLAITADNCLLIDFDDGAQRAYGRAATLKMDSWQEFLDFIDGKSEHGDFIGEYGVKTIVCDTAEELLNYASDYIIEADKKNSRGDGALSLQGYGVLKHQFEKVLKRKLKNKGVDLIIIAHATTEKNGDEIRYIPKVTGGSYDILLGISDLVGYMQIKGGKHILDFTPRDHHFGKNAPGFEVLELPYYTDPTWKGFMQRILDKTHECFNQMSEEQQKAMDIINEFDDVINSIDDVAGFDEVHDKANELDPITRKQVIGLIDQRVTKILCDIIDAFDDYDDATEFIGDHFENLQNRIQKMIDLPLAEKVGVLFNDKLSQTVTSANDINMWFDLVSELPDTCKKAVKKTITEFAKKVGFKFNSKSKEYDDTDASAKSLEKGDEPTAEPKQDAAEAPSKQPQEKKPKAPKAKTAEIDMSEVNDKESQAVINEMRKHGAIPDEDENKLSLFDGAEPETVES